MDKILKNILLIILCYVCIDIFLYALTSIYLQSFDLFSWTKEQCKQFVYGCTMFDIFFSFFLFVFTAD